MISLLSYVHNPLVRDSIKKYIIYIYIILARYFFFFLLLSTLEHTAPENLWLPYVPPGTSHIAGTLGYHVCRWVGVGRLHVHQISLRLPKKV